MLKALEYEILRGVESNGRIRIPLPRRPLRVATIINESSFLEHQSMVHNSTVFLEDRIRDWDWLDGQLRYYSRVADKADKADVLVVYAFDIVPPPASIIPMTDESLAPAVQAPAP